MSAARQVHGQRRDEHRDRQIAGVAGADEHAVEHEDHRGRGLQRGDEPEELLHEGADVACRW